MMGSVWEMQNMEILNFIHGKQSEMTDLLLVEGTFIEIVLYPRSILLKSTLYITFTVILQ